MDTALTRRVESISFLAQAFRDLGYHSKQFGAEVLVKPGAKAAYGFVLFFGGQRTYISDFSTGRKIVPTEAGEVLALFAGCPPEGLAEWFRGLPLPRVRAEDEGLVSEDIDVVRRLFPPEISLEQLMDVALQRGLPCFRSENCAVIVSRRSPSNELGRLFLRENLWCLSMKGGEELRINELGVFDLVYELESICDEHGDTAVDIVAAAYGR